MSQRVALYRGDGRGKFTNVTAQTGIASLPTNWWMGVAVGDYDNDGYEDIYLSAYRGGALLHNERGKSFRDVSREAGIPPQPWGSACAFGDYDNDGKLDLLIGNYCRFGPDSVQLCHVKDFETACSPTVYDAEHPVLYHNDGGGHFRDVTRLVGLNAATGKVLGAVFFDPDGVGHPSLYLADDEVKSDFFLNRGGRFKEIGEEAGAAYTENGKPYGGMGVDYGDINGDGRPDMVVGTFSLENKLVLINQGEHTFLDESPAYGVAGPAMRYLSFGAKLLDFDNDGYLDIMFANGYIADNIVAYEPSRAYREPTLLFRNEGGKRFTDLSASAGPDLLRPIVGRGLATGDFDNDGRVDALVADAEGPPLLLHNETSTTGNSISVRLTGKKSNRDGYGAIVTVEAGGRKQVHICHADGSFFASSDPRVHVGIGSATSATVTVHWPSGRNSRAESVRAGAMVTIREE